MGLIFCFQMSTHSFENRYNKLIKLLACATEARIKITEKVIFQLDYFSLHQNHAVAIGAFNILGGNHCIAITFSNKFFIQQ